MIKKTGAASRDVTKAEAAAPPTAPPGLAADKLEIPARYNDPGASGLTTNVKEGANSYDITLTK